MPLTVSNPILREIGRIAVYQSHIEGQMAIFIHELLRLDEPRGNLITARMSFGALIDLIDSLLRYEFGLQHAHVKRFENIRKELVQLEEHRNKFVHSMWAFGSSLGPDTATRVKVVKNRTKGAKLESTPVTIKELEEVSKAMEQLEWEVGDLRVRICHYEASARPIRT